MTHATSTPTSIAGRVDGLDWTAIGGGLDELGVTPIGGLLTTTECREVADLYDHGQFRSTINMGHKRFGEGEYRYFANPLPPIVTELRASFWPHLLPIAREWAQRRGQSTPWPDSFEEWIDMCHAAGQRRPTPLLLRYGPGDWNALHRDLYGELVFPLQVTVLLSDPAKDFSGGEFMLVEQRPRMQSRGEVVPLAQGDAVIFAVNERPVKGTRGFHRTAMRHGVSSLREGERFTLGIIFHDAA
jgi:uncharacterized protein